VLNLLFDALFQDKAGKIALGSPLFVALFSKYLKDGVRDASGDPLGRAICRSLKVACCVNHAKGLSSIVAHQHTPPKCERICKRQARLFGAMHVQSIKSSARFGV
jgi:hypothetical protein